MYVYINTIYLHNVIVCVCVHAGVLQAVRSRQWRVHLIYLIYTYMHTYMQVCREQCEAGSGGYTCYFRPADSLFGLLRQNLADSRVDSVGAVLSSLALLVLKRKY